MSIRKLKKAAGRFISKVAFVRSKFSFKSITFISCIILKDRGALRFQVISGLLCFTLTTDGFLLTRFRNGSN